MAILVTLGSFKDVFSSIEICSIIKEILLKYGNKNVEVAPICDGGEHTFDVMNYYYDCEKVVVKNIVNPYFKKVTSKYLVHKNEAYIISSEILRLFPNEDNYKTLLGLTDYGLGQLAFDAIKKGYKKINICLGGTSTACLGIGFAQALGAEIFISGKKAKKPVTACQLKDVSKIIFPKGKFKNIKVNVINDCTCSCSEMEFMTKLKIGNKYKPKTEDILSTICKGIINIQKHTKLNFNKNFSGTAGALYFGIESLFETRHFCGSEYFIKLFKIDKKIKDSSCIITGEGRFDAPNTEKGPMKIVNIAKKYNKKVIFLCGQVKEDLFKSIPVNGIFKNNKLLKEYGIRELITCQNDYEKKVFTLDYKKRISYFKKNTALVLEGKLESLKTCKK